MDKDNIYIRKLQRTSTHSYVLNVPKEVIDELSWREKQKLVIEFNKKNSSLVIRDWKK